MTAKVSLISILALITVLFSACTTPVAIDPLSGQEQTANYQSGYFYAPIDGEPGPIFRTAIRVLDEAGYYRTGELHKETAITIYARKVGDEKVLVRIKATDPGFSELRIRVGAFGNLAESQSIYAKIRDAM
ncbi:MAG: DUF3568 domain-containing protein [Opitutales bacterium]|nr:DUF3568 domain-containing protein [Opitutales bacterium]MDP4693315.1 DUF3568 domain-containing protein [Opitutales bacterium]